MNCNRNRHNYSTFQGDEPGGSKRIDNLLPACPALYQVIKSGFNVIQSTVELLNHVRFQTTLDQAGKFLPQELG